MLVSNILTFQFSQNQNKKNSWKDIFKLKDLHGNLGVQLIC